jgi:outer membrane receptor for ferrienterochelin and colicin
MHHFIYVRLRRHLLLSVSSLVLLAASGLPSLAQNESASPSQPEPGVDHQTAAPQVDAPAQSAAPQDAKPEDTKPIDAKPEEAKPEAPQPAAQGTPPDGKPASTDTAATPASGGNVLPETRISAPVEAKRARKAQPVRVVRTQPSSSAPVRISPEPRPILNLARPSVPTLTPAQVVEQQHQTFDTARQAIFAPSGTRPYKMTQDNIEALPQGANTSLDRVLLQAPGVTQDAASSGDLHIRNEHANVQYRINGVMLPDGVGAFGQILDSKIVGGLSLITGALPAQYGLHTAGVVDITTKQNAFDNSGSIGLYGGSRGTISPSLDYGGTVGNTQYYFSGSYLGSNIGLENVTAANNAIHDHTDQGKGFAYISTVIDPTLRLTYMGGVSNNQYQIPNNPGQPLAFNPFGLQNFNSANLNENQREFNQFNVLALQYSNNGLDVQTAYFNRTSVLHFKPDPLGDLAFNGVASDIYRQSVVNGIQTDLSYKWSDTHTLRAGLTASVERSFVNNASAIMPADPAADTPVYRYDSSSKTGYLFGAYIGDEWKISKQVTVNAGLRFDQMSQYVNANQISPRLSATYTPVEGTVFHAGYARYFTPPQQVLAAPTNLALVAGTAQQPEVGLNSPVLPERSHYFDVGVTHRLMPGLEIGVDAYYKIAQNLLDDGQFGAAYILTAFNYARGVNTGVEFSAKYTNGDFSAYGNLAMAKQIATNVVSNQYLFESAELAYIGTNYVYTDHAQRITASAGASYLWQGTRFSADLIYGSGLRNGFANTGTMPPYWQVNLGASHDFNWFSATKPTTLRFNVVNLFDSVYQIRDGSGIGVFAPQYGPRRGFFVSLAQKF